MMVIERQDSNDLHLLGNTYLPLLAAVEYTLSSKSSGLSRISSGDLHNLNLASLASLRCLLAAGSHPTVSAGEVSDQSSPWAVRNP